MKISAIHLAQNPELTKTEIRSALLVRRQLAPSASCATQAGLMRRGLWRKAGELQGAVPACHKFGGPHNICSARTTRAAQFIAMIGNN
jgi:hypothetical protein